MNDYEIGEIAQASDGLLYRFKGGDPKNRANWEPADAPPTASPVAPELEQGSSTPLAEIQEPTPAESRLSQGGGNAVTDFLRMAGQGATFGFADELVGLLRGREAGEASRQRVKDLRELNPKSATIPAEIAGGLWTAALPIGQGARAVRAGMGLPGAMARGAAIGGVQGGLLGVGEGEGDLKARGRSAAPYAIGGAAAGGLLASAPAIVNVLGRRAKGRAARLAAGLEETSGVSGDINTTRAALDQLADEARVKYYSTFDAMPPMPRATIDSSALPQAVKDALPDGPVAFMDLQELRTSLKGDPRTNSQASALTGFMEKHFPGTRVADRGYAEAMSGGRTLRAGAKSASKSAADIRYAQSKVPASQVDLFRQGQIQRILRNLRTREEKGAVHGLLLDAGPETQDMVRTLFPEGQGGDAAFGAFWDRVSREKSAAKVAHELHLLGKIGAYTAGGFMALRGYSILNP